MRSVPGFDDVVRKVIGIMGGERCIRLLFQGNSVRVGPKQVPRWGAARQQHGDAGHPVDTPAGRFDIGRREDRATAIPITDFVAKLPVEGAEPSVKTEVRILDD